MENVATQNIVDVRDVAPPQRHPMIMGTFGNLQPGESFMLVNDHDPKPLLYQFQNEHDGEFDWWYLEQGPEQWRVTVARRKEADPNRTVTEYFETDHRRLDAIYDRFQDAVREGRWDEAASGIREFILGLTRHIKAEEEILFPVFEQKTGMVDAGPTFVMRMEHTDIKDLLEKLLDGALDSDAEKVAEASRSFVSLLTDHNMKEEHILYPESDQFMNEAERTQVVKKAQAV